MGNFKDQSHEEVKLKAFSVPEWFKEEVAASQKFSEAKKKSPGKDGVHYKMLNVYVPFMTDLIVEIWRLVGRTRKYSVDWKVGLLTPIFKKGNPEVPMNPRPLCILSCIRKIIEAVITYRILKEVQMCEEILLSKKPIDSGKPVYVYVGAVVRAGKIK